MGRPAGKDSEDLVLSPGRGIRNVVVWLQTPPAGAKWEAPLPAVQMDQKQCMFAPRVVVMPVGGTIEFLNNDRLLHNLHSRGPSENPAFNRTQPKGRTIPIVFRKPEILRVDCDLHPWMRAWVVVAQHPFYAVTSDQGEFTLNNVSPGRYTLEVWQETLGTVSREIAVSEAPVTTVTVEMARSRRVTLPARASESSEGAPADCRAWPGMPRRPPPGPAARHRSARTR